MLEDSSTVLRDLTLENPIRAIREISQDITCRRRVRLANGREMRALDIQTEYLERAAEVPRPPGLPPRRTGRSTCGSTASRASRPIPSRCGENATGWPSTGSSRRCGQRHDIPLSHPKVAMVDLMYHDVDRQRGLFYKLQQRDEVERTCTDEAIADAMIHAPGDDPGPPPGCVRQAGQGAPPGLHGRLGAPQAERPGPAHGPAEGPVQVPRRAGGAPHPVALTVS